MRKRFLNAKYIALIIFALPLGFFTLGVGWILPFLPSWRIRSRYLGPMKDRISMIAQFVFQHEKAAIAA